LKDVVKAKVYVLIFASKQLSVKHDHTLSIRW